MTRRLIRDLAASITARLLERHRSTGEEFQRLPAASPLNGSSIGWAIRRIDRGSS